MQAIARARYVRTSPRKARLVIDEIRGKYVDEALAILQFTPNLAARLIEKVVKSAVANAENNFRMNAEDLKITKATVDGGPNIMKRLRYAPMGRGYRFVKRMSHITIVVDDSEPRPEKKARQRRGPARVAKAPRAAGKTASVGKKSQASVPQPQPEAAAPNKVDQSAEAKGGE